MTTELTLDLFMRMWPHANSQITGLAEGIVSTSKAIFPKYGFNSNLVIAHFFGQVSHECGAGEEMVENLNYSARGLCHTWPSRFSASRAAEYAHNPKKIANAVYGGRMGNLLGTDDGWNYRGRGLSQTTGREAYAKLGERLQLDLVGNPDLVNDPNHTLEIGVADFIMCGCLPYAQADNVVVVTKRLNGGFIGLEERKAWLVKWKKALEV